MFFMKKIKSLEKTIAELEKRHEKVEEKQNEKVISQRKKDDNEELTPTQILNEWLNGESDR